jgi:hypothetical protein
MMNFEFSGKYRVVDPLRGCPFETKAEKSSRKSLHRYILNRTEQDQSNVAM